MLGILGGIWHTTHKSATMGGGWFRDERCHKKLGGFKPGVLLQWRQLLPVGTLIRPWSDARWLFQSTFCSKQVDEIHDWLFGLEKERGWFTFCVALRRVFWAQRPKKVCVKCQLAWRKMSCNRSLMGCYLSHDVIYVDAVKSVDCPVPHFKVLITG